MKLFKKKYTLVPTGNIKQYIVDEFNRANKLDDDKRILEEEQNKLKKELEDKQDEIYKANVIIEQIKYKSGKAKQNYEEDLENYKKQIESLQKDLKKEKEKANTYQIKIIELQKKYDELKISKLERGKKGKK